ncbi:amidohydrolase family protein [Pendulispora albinea]|uniref:Amidohydrolase family protein n=1 Tax=Pendulispora albinea TaxID=2741071 RepID=A0ABZ2LLT4_9BACT
MASCIALGSLGLMLTAFGPSSCEGERRVTVNVTEGTNLAATLSPDGQRVIFDLQGALWSVPASGGDATRLTDPLLEPARPHWSPAGDWVAFQAYSGGTFHIWLMRPDGSGLRALTSGHGDDREPRFSPDGARIAFSSDRAFEGSYDIWVADVATGSLQRWTSAGTDEFEPDWLPGGSEIAYAVGTGAVGTSVQASTSRGAARTLIAAPAGMRIASPSVSPDGQRVAYTQQIGAPARPAESLLMLSGTRVGANTDVFPFHAHWLGSHSLLYTANGKIHVADVDAGTTRTIDFRAKVEAAQSEYHHRPRDFDADGPRRAKGIVGPSLSPDGRQILFQALNQIWVMTRGQPPRALTNDRYFKADPSWSPDGRKIAYSSDKAGTEDLYIVELEGGGEQRVTSLPGAEVSSAWSPDGRMLAFQNQTNATFTVEIATGNVRQVLPSLFAPSKPSWHAGGATLAVAALKPYSRRFREGTSQILTVNLTTGALTYTEPAPFESISTRGEDGPVYAPDGSAVAFVMQSTLWIKPVNAQGIPQGDPVRINDEVTDAPSWSGDSRTLLYLSNGKLREVDRAGGPPRDVPLELAYRPEMPEGRTVIHAGKLWDGRGANVMTDVDLVIDGHRIARIRPHDAHADDGARVTHIDASRRTVLPGLWESHTHQWISGKFHGDRLGRLWLAYGVTSLDSVGDPAYRAVETAEAFASGERVGPRFFPTGEAIDGERIYYNFMRPVTGGDAQLARELARAQALDYDMVKTYVRLPHRDQAKIARFAHERLGVHVASHYMPPVMAYGVDGITHVSATARLGFAYTRSMAGVSYGDMRDSLRLSGMFGISTTFTPSLYADDPGMVDDPRLLALNTPWDQTILRNKRDTAVTTDQTLLLESLRREEDTVRSILAAGGTMLAGTDSPLDDVATALHLNLRSQVKLGGLPPWRALQTATKLAAEAISAGDDLGTLERGKLADLVIVEGNPLDRIEDLANVRAVMKNGKLHTVEALMAPFPPKPAPAAAAGRQLAPGLEGAAERYWWHDPENMIEDDHR